MRNVFFSVTASVYTHPVNPKSNPDIFKSALLSGKNEIKSAANPIKRGRRVNPDSFESDDVAKSFQSLTEKINLGGLVSLWRML